MVARTDARHQPDAAALLFRCPRCRGGLTQARSGFRCPVCAGAFPVNRGLPDFFILPPGEDDAADANLVWERPEVVEARDTFYRLCHASLIDGPRRPYEYVDLERARAFAHAERARHGSRPGIPVMIEESLLLAHKAV
ncbi:MAG TPA: hypothetical protein VHN78_02080 [Chloroflexota bacterium]|nr:hypothetical protein [Chloroflexota bacterium]